MFDGPFLGSSQNNLFSHEWHPSSQVYLQCAVIPLSDMGEYMARPLCMVPCLSIFFGDAWQSPLILLLNFLQSSVSTVFGLKAAGSEAWSTYVSISHTVQTGYLGRLLGQGVLTQYPLLPMNGDLLLP